VCEYCGCQQLDVIGRLTDEHERVRNLGRLLTDACESGDLAAARRLAGEMRRVLGPHTRVEEDGLFPELAAEFGEQLARLEADHLVIDGVLLRLETAPPPDWPQQARTAITLLFEHILKEQDGVFPAALSVVSTAGWERVEGVRAALDGAAVT
jgi:hemerythrin-like domain-containing protein